MENEEIDLDNLEKQLGCPEGLDGIEVAVRMSVANKNLIFSTVDVLTLKQEEKVLELGHGNCSHLFYVLKQANEIHYDGVEISETMHSEAKRINQNFSKESNSNFHLYDGLNLPFESEEFDKIFTVNTLYFWSNPKKLLSEINRVLKPKGEFFMSIVDKQFMKQLPFVGNRFNLYSVGDIVKLFGDSNFTVIYQHNGKEQVLNNLSQEIERAYHIIGVKKRV